MKADYVLQKGSLCSIKEKKVDMKLFICFHAMFVHTFPLACGWRSQMKFPVQEQSDRKAIKHVWVITRGLRYFCKVFKKRKAFSKWKNWLNWNVWICAKLKVSRINYGIGNDIFYNSTLPGKNYWSTSRQFNLFTFQIEDIFHEISMEI